MLGLDTVCENTPLPDEIFPINVFHLPTPKFIHTHWHQHLELIYMVSGTAIIQVDAQLYHVQAGDIVFVNSRQIHGSHEESLDARMVAVVFNESLLKNTCLDSTEMRYILPTLNRQLSISNLISRQNAIAIGITESLDRLVLEFHLHDLGSELFIKSELFRIFGLLIKYFSRPALSQMRESDLTQNLHALLLEIPADLSSRLTVAEAAAKLNISISHFCRLFRKLTGTTLVQYRNKLRLQECEHLLKTTTLTVTNIAYQLGFSDASHLEKVFKQFKKVTPIQYRTKFASDDNFVQ